ncbi:MAG: GntR family transcriptional regulator [Hespellia sp.]|nr:GntR family transcriptional regulator [Hespellia sp.]
MVEQQLKYEEIVRWMKKKIDGKELLAGQKIPSENELASIFSVSRQTVRHAISVIEDEGLVERRRGSGTYVRGMKRKDHFDKKTMRVAIVTTYVDEYIFPTMLKELERKFSKANYTIQIAFTHNTVEKERIILKNFLGRKVIDGIIAEPVKSGLPNPNLKLYEELEAKGIPIIFLNTFYLQLPMMHVCMDDKRAGQMATEHLLQCGHTRIAGIFKSDDGQGHRRYAGYMEALMERGIKIREDRITWIDTLDAKHMGEYAGPILNRLTNCTACVCYNDEIAVKLVGICKEAGIKIPEDLSIVGIDDSDLARLCEIPLTSVRNPIVDLAGITAEKMVRMLSGDTDLENVELEPSLVMRNSVQIVSSI